MINSLTIVERPLNGPEREEERTEEERRVHTRGWRGSKGFP
jgi:hypothetical protein